MEAVQQFAKRLPKPLLYTFAGYGFLSLLSKVYGVLSAACHYRFKPFPDYGKRYGRGSYVLITGASDGIGEELAYEFAKRGFKLILVGRNEDKLNKVKENCVIRLQATVKCIVEDLATNDLAVFQRIADQVRTLDVSVLVNNAGGISYVPFAAVGTAEIQSLISLNCCSHVLLTRLLLPQLLARREKSLIINTASLLATVPAGYMAVYSATKAFIRFFSLSLREEVRGKIDVFAASPSRINTKMPGYPGVNSEVTSIEETVAGILTDAATEPESFCSFKHFWIRFKLSFFCFSHQVRLVTRRTKARYEAMSKSEAALT